MLKLRRLLNAFDKNELIEIIADNKGGIIRTKSEIKEELWYMLELNVVSIGFTKIYYNGYPCYGYSVVVC